MPVLIVEGEKAADAAADRLPGFVAMTWPGGAKAVSKADWSPLAGRRVVVWPDADEPGVKAAADVAKACRAAGAASVAIVSLPPVPPAWDLADDWPDCLTASDAVQMVEAALNAQSEPGSPEAPPSIYHPSSYIHEPATGWWFQPPGNGDGDPPPPQKVCDSFEVIAEARDSDGLGWSLVLEFVDRDRRKHRELVGRGELAGEGVDVRRRLMDAGLRMATGKSARERFLSLLASIVTDARAQVVASCGWHQGRYILPNKTIGGAPDADKVIWRGRPGATYHKEAGSYDAWRSEVAAQMSGNPLGLFMMSAAFAGPLMAKVGAEGGGFHVRGGSSSGKTTAMVVAGSVCGGGGPQGFCQSWRNTDNALEAVALAHNDGALLLDEIRALSPEAAGASAYNLATGATKGRLRTEGDLRARPSWLVMILSTGEIGLSDMVALSKTKERTYAGQELRLIDIQADQGAGMGCWEDIHGAVTPGVFSETVRRAADRHYGHALLLFVERFMDKEADMLSAFEAIKAAFLAQVLKPSDQPQIRRGAQRFAVVAAAGEISALLDVTPWAAGEALAAAARLFERWAREFGRTAPREASDAIRAVRKVIQQQSSCFTRLKPEQTDDEATADAAAEADKSLRAGEARSLKTYGYYADHSEVGRLFHFHPESFKEILAGMDVVEAAKALKIAGHLYTIPSENRLQHKVRIPGTKLRPLFYSIKHTILNGDDDEYDS